MRLMADVPLLLQQNPVSALVICFGVGNTASAIATHDSIRHLDIVDLNRNVFETAPEFAATNFEVYGDPRVRLINDDGRSFLRLSRDTYDLITSEPPPPMQAGVYRLYSREYYQDVLAHLTPTGMMTQWLPVYQMPAKAAEEAIATFLTVFPHTLLYSGISTELILLGSREPIEIDRLWQRFPATGRARADLAAIFVDTPAKLGARIVRTDATLRRDYLRVETISDERNDLEQMFLPTKSVAVIYDPQEVLTWLRVEGSKHRTITPSVVQWLVSCQMCGNARLVRQDLLDQIVWAEVIRLLEGAANRNPHGVPSTAPHCCRHTRCP